MSLEPQLLAGRFRIEAPLGAGGMGSVSVAFDTAVGRRVAIKQMRPELAEDPDSLARFRDEAMALAHLSHPNIVQLLDFHEGGPTQTFLVLELLEGETLAARLRRPDASTWPAELAVDYARQVLSALAAAHARGVVHRDIKPSNLLVVPLPARRDLVKVLDFGIAKLAESTLRRRPTTAGVLLGTPAFMSPEQALGAPADARADIYAVGLVLYRMLAGVNPFEGMDLQTTLERVAHVMPVELQRLRPDVPPHVAAAIMRALDKNPGQRFPSAVAFAEALGLGDVTMLAAKRSLPPGAAPVQPAFASGPPAAASASGQPGSVVTLTAPPRGRDRTPLALGVAVAVAVVATGALGAGVVWYLSRSNAPGALPSASGVDASTSDAAADVPPPTSATPSALPSGSSTPRAGDSVTATRRAPTAAASASASASAGTGKCGCYPSKHVPGHPGTNVRLAPRPLQLQCQCFLSSGAALCNHPVPDGSTLDINAPSPCKEKWRDTTLGAPCEGFDFHGQRRTSTTTVGTCQLKDHRAADVYPGPDGRACRGLTLSGEMVDGITRCRQ